MPRVPHSTDDLQEAETELQRAWLHGDVIALDALLDEEAELVGPGERSRTKGDELDGCRTGSDRWSSVVVERLRVRVMEELGVTDVVASVVGRRDGEPFEARLRFVRTWRLAEGWILVSSHATPVRAARGVSAA